MKEILRIFPSDMQSIIQQHVKNKWTRLQEIRCRLNQPVELNFDNETVWIQELIIQRKQVTSILSHISAYSLYRMEDELREGYITIQGGHRIGLAGEVNVYKKHVQALQHITFLNIRIAKEHPGSAQRILPYIYQGNYKHTLIIGAPKTGKTSLIRDIARLISSGWKHIPSQKVGLIDERSEIAASHKGLPTLSVGARTDVLDRCPKAEGMMMMIRSMSPEVLIVDEIGSEEDVQAVLEAMHAGVSVICTAHGSTITDLKRRPFLSTFFSKQAFDRIVFLHEARQPGTIEAIYDAHWNEIPHANQAEVGNNEMDWRASFH